MVYAFNSRMAVNMPRMNAIRIMMTAVSQLIIAHLHSRPGQGGLPEKADAFSLIV
jgi:hypothetical protein